MEPADALSKEQRGDLPMPVAGGVHADEIFRLVVEFTPHAIVLADAQGRIVLVNLGAEKLFGYARGELIGHPVEILVPERFRGSHAGHRKAYANHTGPRPMGRGRDLYALREDGTEVPVEIGLNPIQTAEGPMVLSAIIDITERKRAEVELTDSLLEVSEMKAALDEHAIVAITDPQGRITFVNDKFCAISKYPREELLGQDHRIINSGFHPPEFIRDLWTTITHGRVWHGEIRNRAKDGSLYWVDTTIVPFLDERGKPRQYVAIRADITERKRAEAAAAQLAAIVESSDDAIVGKDMRGIVTSWNAGAEKVFGYSAGEMIGQPIMRLIAQDRHAEEERILSQIARGENVRHFETERIRKDGSPVDVSVTVSAIRNSAGRIVGASKVARDITERKLAEEEIHRLNTELELRVIERTAQLEAANKELEAFSYSVSHDLRAPLRAVDGFSQAVLEDYGPHLPEEGRRYLKTIREGAQKMGMLIDDLLTFSRLSRGPLRKQEVDVGALVGSVLEDLSSQREERRIDLRITEMPACAGDPALLRQVWFNLLSNALKYTRKRDVAVVEIGCERKPEGDVYFVRDNGTGFDMRYAGKLFGVFQRLHRAEEYEGTGVGLAIVQRVIHRHGGRVWADAAVDRGATFYFTLEGGTTP
jgi:PAS domain S-box-containing protein